jgi:hypothetical protein
MPLGEIVRCRGWTEFLGEFERIPVSRFKPYQDSHESNEVPLSIYSHRMVFYLTVEKP